MRYTSFKIQFCSVLLVLVALGLPACKPEVNRKQDAHGQYALHTAAREGDLAVLAKLFEEGANANVTDVDGVAPLHRVARDGQNEVVELLLKNHANPNLSTRAGWTALQLTLWKGHDDTAELLMRYGATPKGSTPEGYNTVHLAVMGGAVHALDLLFRDWKQVQSTSKPDVNAKDKKGRTPLEIAIERRDDACASVLLLRGANALEVDETGNTLLHRLAGTGKIGLAQTLVGAGVLPDARNSEGKTAYDIAVEKGDLVLAEWLPTVMDANSF